MSKIRSNFVANFFGKGTPALLLVIMTPYYLHTLGIEAYGLIGFSLLLLNFSNLFDFGFGPTLSRALIQKESNIPDLFYTFEILYGIVFFLLSILLFFSTPLITTHWLNIENLSQTQVTSSLLLMFLGALLQWVFSYYAYCLMGLQNQNFPNALKIAGAIVNVLFVLLTFNMFWPSLELFFTGPILTNSLQILLARRKIKKLIPISPKPHFNFHLIKEHAGFAKNMFGITCCSFLLMGIDKILLSRWLPLEIFGYYSLALVVASSLHLIIYPLFTTLFTKFSELGAQKALVEKSFQFISLFLIPIALTLIFFSDKILLFWTQEADASAITCPIVQILVFGTLLNGYLNVPYALFLGLGMSRWVLIQSIVSILIIIPTIFFLTLHFGAIGSASGWVLLNLGSLCNMLYRLQKIEPIQIPYIRILLSLITCSTLLMLIRGFIPLPQNNLFLIFTISFIIIGLLIINTSLFPLTRNIFIRLR